MSWSGRLDAYQRRHPWLGLPLAVLYKFYDDRGAHLAAIITYYGFVSLFPLLLLLVTVLGYVLHGNATLQHRLLRSALTDFPIIGPQIAHNLTGYHGSGAGLLVGILGTLYGGMGVSLAAQAVFNRIYAVPRHSQPNPFVSRLRSLLLLVLLGSAVLVTTGLTSLTTATSAFGASISGAFQIGAQLAAFALNVATFTVAFQLLTGRRLRWREVLIGGIVAAVGWQLLQSLGTYYLSHKLRSANEVYGVFGLVIGLIAWIYLEALIVVLAAEINVVYWDRMYPRALLALFSDDIRMTEADAAAYTNYVRSERFKGFEQISVDFAGQHPAPADSGDNDVAPGPDPPP